MGKRKQIFILICILVLAAVNSLLLERRGLCVEDEFSQGPMGLDRRLEKLEIYFETEMYTEAAILLDELIAEFPDEPRFKYLKAVIDYQQGDYDSARSVFIEFVEQYPQAPEPYYILAEINLEKDNLDLARQYLAKYCALVPEDVEAKDKLDSILKGADESSIIIVQDGREDSALVKKIGFYGGCVHSYQEGSIKLVNGSFCTWSSMGIDFAFPLDLRGKQIVFKLKGKRGGENLELTFRDKFAKGHTPQLVIAPEEGLLPDWKKVNIVLERQKANIDLSQVVHLGLEFGFSTVQNPAQSTLFVKDIIIEDGHN